MTDKNPFYTQIYHPVFNPEGLPHTEDCGPTSLAMALVTMGLEIRLRSLAANACIGIQGLIDQARFAMFSDGISSINDKKSPFHKKRDRWCENPQARQTLTNLEDLARGALNCGVSSQLVDRNLFRGTRLPHLILAGDPSLPRAYGARLNVGYRGGHFIYLTGQSSEGPFLIHDPLCLSGPALVSKQELESFLRADIFGDIIGVELSMKQTA